VVCPRSAEALREGEQADRLALSKPVVSLPNPAEGIGTQFILRSA